MNLNPTWTDDPRELIADLELLTGNEFAFIELHDMLAETNVLVLVPATGMSLHELVGRLADALTDELNPAELDALTAELITRQTS